MIMRGIYKITSPSGKIYIGQSTNIPKRIKRYERLECKNQPKLYNSLLKYGFKNHSIIIIEQCNDDVNLIERETYWKMYYNVFENDSLCCRFDGKNGKMSEESRKKLSCSIKNMWQKMEMTEKKRRIKLLHENKGKLKKGVPKTESHKKKLSESQNKSETKEKRSNSLKNYWKKLSPQEYEIKSKQYRDIFKRPDVIEKLKKNNPNNRPEVLLKKSEIMKKREKIECPHCHKKMDKANLTKYHLNKCPLFKL